MDMRNYPALYLDTNNSKGKLKHTQFVKNHPKHVPFKFAFKLFSGVRDES